MFTLHSTNCNCLSLNKKMVISDSIADSKNENNIVFIKKLEFEYNSLAKTSCPDASVHRLNTKINPPEIAAAKSKNKVCIR